MEARLSQWDKYLETVDAAHEVGQEKETLVPGVMET